MHDNGLRIRTTRVETGAHFVSVTGELDLYSAPLLKEELERLPATSDAVVDLDGLSIIDSIALGVLLSASRRLRGSDSMLIVVCEQENIRRLFERTRLNQTLLVEDSLDDAHRYLIGRVLLKRLRRGASVAL